MKFLLLCLVLGFALTKFNGVYRDDSQDNAFCSRMNLVLEGSLVFGIAYDDQQYPIAYFRGSLDSTDTNVAKGKWIKGSQIDGSFEFTWGTNGFTGTWWFGESDGWGRRFKMTFTEISNLPMVVDTPSQTHRGDDIYATIRGSYSDSTNDLTIAVEPKTGVAIGYAVLVDDTLGPVPLYFSGQIFYLNGPIFSGRIYSNSIMNINVEAVIPIDAVIVMAFNGKTFNLQQQNNNEPSEADVLPNPTPNTKYTTAWTGFFIDAEETSFMVNVNGHMFGTYYSSGKVRGSFNGPISSDGKSVEGYWYSPSSQPDEEPYGRMTLTFDNNGNMAGIWNFGEAEPAEANKWIVGPLGYQNKSSVFTNQFLAQAFDETDGNTLNNAWYDTYGNDATVDEPFYVCTSGSDITSSYWGTIGYSELKSFQNDHVAVGGFYDSDGAGVNHFVNYYGYLRIFYFPLDEARNEKKDEAAFDISYVPMETNLTTEQCSANENVKEKYENSSATLSFSLLSVLILGLILF